ncbi:universal stress protein [Nonomuraea terrae]|uniref:Universal stress protein n=1 Tax=Nonomuraea terrae TaxID=2530383 RepID=A0A4R4YLH5_9ACTN|nr:universal stress protein [Nonomuraea terrae]TDD44312.1 universal stress protein [Nonomuraea terrae]
MMDKAIVVGVDGSQAAKAALAWAADDAVRTGLPLRIVHVREPWRRETEPTASNVRETMAEWHMLLLAESAEQARAFAPAAQVSTALATGAVVQRLKTEAETAVTLVVGGKGHGRLPTFAIGSVTAELAGHTASPLVVVRTFTMEQRGEIVIGYDGSPDADAAMAFALEQARFRAARIRVLHGSRYPALAPHPVGYGPVPMGETNELGGRLAHWREKSPHVEMVETIVPGSAVSALVEASRTADLVVVGSRGRGGFASAVLGSVSHSVVRRARCAVAVVSAARPDPNRADDPHR